MRGAYYNENEPFAAEWLRALIAAGHIAPGDVDDRSIEDVTADDLRGYAQCHFFAGIGGWSHALRLAGWDDDRPVWTGSCPCQPFSAAGKGGAFDDKRHLWPVFFDLIAKCGPDVVLGEQVASPLGLAWLDHVCADLEGAGYAAGAVDTCAAGFGAPHIRQRLYWAGVRAGTFGDAHDARLEIGWSGPDELLGSEGRQTAQRLAGLPGMGSGLAQPDYTLGRAGAPAGHDAGGADAGRPQGAGDAQAGGGGGGVADADGRKSGRAGALQPGGQHGLVPQDGVAGLGLATASTRRPAPASPAARLDDGHRDGSWQAFGLVSGSDQGADGDSVRPGPTNGFWRDCDWLGCRDGKWRPVESGTFPLVNGTTARVGRLRGYGNAIVAQQAAAFCEAVKEAVSC